MGQSTSTPLRRALAALLAVLIGLGPLATPTYAALTALADQPLNVQNQAKPNIVLTVDDSTSMLYDFLPDSVIGKYCRDITGNMNAACGTLGQNTDLTGNQGKYISPGYIFQQYGIPYGAYNNAYDISGPGSGCDLLSAAPTCIGGIDPGALPGLERYPNPAGPPTPKSPKAGKPYEYWTLWPAPVHNSELNHLYYNPRLTYDPPVLADGTSYPQMNAANTNNWTRVPADPWAASVKYVDLTASVTVGLWCNSDWTDSSLVTNPAYCRTNGTGASAATSSASSLDGDYGYPWAPPGIDPASGPTIATSIAYSKVDVASNNALKPAWLTAQDPKYFYENDNTLWCDATNALWPQTGPLRPQLCDSPPPSTPRPQTCDNFRPQSCSAGSAQTCSNTHETCNGAQNQTCDNLLPQSCNGALPQVCVPAATQTCDGLGPQTCGGISSQTCNNITPQTCVNFTGQACNNVMAPVCNIVAPVCNAPNPATCTTDWDPPGCNLCVSECGACRLRTTCPPGTCSSNGASCQTALDCPSSGTCGGNGAACTSDSQCPTQAGTCSRIPSSCFVAGDCPSYGNCSANTHTTCQTDSACPTIPGQCSIDGSTCTSDGQCPNEGHCSLTNNICPPDPCSTQPGRCTIDRLSCFDDATCVRSGSCSLSNAACNSDPQCAPFGGSCTIDGNACSVDPNCGMAGHCSLQPTVACHVAGSDPDECPVLAGRCSISTATSCTADANCPPVAGTCSGTGVSCLSDAACPNVGRACSITSLSCAGDDQCPTQPGTCSETALACTSHKECPPQVTPGQCTITHAACTVAAPAGDPACPPVASPSGAAMCSDLLGRVALPNAGFEIPFVADLQYGPPPTGWVFGGSAGIQRFGGPFGAADSGDGSQTAFLQGAASVSQTLTLGAGSYRLSFLAARRPSDLPAGSYQPVQLRVDGVAVGSPIAPSADFRFNSFAIDFPVASAGLHTITLAGIDPSNKTSFIDAVSLSQGKSLLEDANRDGVVCRHNNKLAGPGYTSGRFTYPDTKYNTPVTAGTGDNACVASPRYATIPRHYWKTSIEWCDKAIATAGHKWLGYGTPSGGNCQDDQDTSHIYPRFYQFGQPAGTDNDATSAFQRIDLDIAKRATAVYDHGLDGLGDPIIRTFDGPTPDVSEMTNYANWFAYYRTRTQAVKTVTSITFKELNSKYRVGFHTLFKLDAFLNVADFDAGQKTAWYAKLFGVTVPLGQETPTLDAMVRIGEYFSGTSRIAGANDPITLSCQKNYHILFTDGYTNQPDVPTTLVGNQDDTVPNYPDSSTKPILGLVPGNAWPGPFRENVDGSVSNSLSDYATYYWVTDLRTTGAQSSNNVAASDKDPAAWQHVNFAAVSLGTSGKLPASNQSVTEDRLTNGTLQWPKPYPTVNNPDNSGVDDLWHAALNGRGRFVNAQSVDELKLGIGKVLADTTNTQGARNGAGFQGVNVTGASNNFIYRIRFEPDWAGSLTKVQIDPSTGAEIKEIWKAATQLSAQLQVVPGIKDTPWFTERKIVTVDESSPHKGVPFLWANLGANQKDSLFPGKPSRGQLVLEFLRGSRVNEGSKLYQFRVRDNVLGDIVDSSPVYVGKPNQPYRDSDDPGYSAFKSALADRAGRVYVGANEGMFHAFDDATGNEAWAYIPSVFYRGGTAGGDPKAGLGALAYQDGALPPFKHHFFVDSTARITDVFFAGSWHTIAVGGLGKGGKMYYALDVTQPADITTEAAAAGKVLWEFTDADMGYSYGKPIIAKTRAFGWVVIVASGYNNASGKGNLYFINPSNGSTLKVMTTNAGSPDTPSGLAHPAGYTKDFRNQLVEQVYAGDLLGNFWRFDVSDPDPTKWTFGRLASLVDAGGTAQPVTTPPQIEIDITNGVDRWVFVGTGKLYDDSDAGSIQIQTMYAFRDGTANTPWDLPSPVLSRDPATGVVAVSHTSALDFGLSNKPDKGWFDDLPTGQRIIVPVQAALSIVAYVGTSPQTDPCLTGLRANVYARQFSDGKSVLQNDSTSPILESIAVDQGGVGLEFVALETASGSIPDVRLAITLGTTGQVIFLKPKLGVLTPGHRMSWRLLGQ